MARAVERDERPRAARRWLRGCARAISSLPVPVSPRMSTLLLAGRCVPRASASRLDRGAVPDEPFPANQPVGRPSRVGVGGEEESLNGRLEHGGRPGLLEILLRPRVEGGDGQVLAAGEGEEQATGRRLRGTEASQAVDLQPRVGVGCGENHDVGPPTGHGGLGFSNGGEGVLEAHPVQHRAHSLAPWGGGIDDDREVRGHERGPQPRPPSVRGFDLWIGHGGCRQPRADHIMGTKPAIFGYV